MPKSSTERVKAYRNRIRAQNPPKNPPKTGLERAREFRARKKALREYFENPNLLFHSTMDSANTNGLDALSSMDAALNHRSDVDNLNIVASVPYRENMLNTYLCPKCTFEANWKFALRHHQKRHHGVQSLESSFFDCENKVETYTCLSCNFETTLKTILLKHQLKPSEPVQDLENESFSCSHCKLKTFSKLFLMKHQDLEETNTVQELSCVVKIENSLNLSQRYVKEVQWFKCSKCYHRAITKDFLEEHVRLKHSSRGKVTKNKKCDCKGEKNLNHSKEKLKVKRRSLKCCYCKYRATTTYTIDMHMRNKHNIGESEWFKCSQCYYTGKYKFQMEKHLEKVHNITLKCSQCKFKTQKQMMMRKHVLEMHTELEWFECKFCKFKTATNEIGIIHMQSKHPYVKLEPTETPILHEKEPKIEFERFYSSMEEKSTY